MDNELRDKLELKEEVENFIKNKECMYLKYLQQTEEKDKKLTEKDKELIEKDKAFIKKKGGAC